MAHTGIALRPLEALLLPEQAAELLAIDPKKLNRMRWEGCGPKYVKFGRDVRYDPAVIREYIRDHTRVPAVEAFMETRHAHR